MLSFTSFELRVRSRTTPGAATGILKALFGNQELRNRTELLSFTSFEVRVRSRTTPREGMLSEKVAPQRSCRPGSQQFSLRLTRPVWAVRPDSESGETCATRFMGRIAAQARARFIRVFKTQARLRRFGVPRYVKEQWEGQPGGGPRLRDVQSLD